MRQIKAFVRCFVVDKVVKALEAVGVPGVTVSRVQGVGYGYEPEHFSLAPRDVTHAPQVAKVEVVCAAKDANRLVRAIVD
ncbi:MAG: P-II family nitrogen regulator, partial [Byssovorax sp.]